MQPHRAASPSRLIALIFHRDDHIAIAAYAADALLHRSPLCRFSSPLVLSSRHAASSCCASAAASRSSSPPPPSKLSCPSRRVVSSAASLHCSSAMASRSSSPPAPLRVRSISRFLPLRLSLLSSYHHAAHLPWQAARHRRLRHRGFAASLATLPRRLPLFLTHSPGHAASLHCSSTAARRSTSPSAPSGLVFLRSRRSTPLGCFSSLSIVTSCSLVELPFFLRGEPFDIIACAAGAPFLLLDASPTRLPLLSFTHRTVQPRRSAHLPCGETGVINDSAASLAALPLRLPLLSFTRRAVRTAITAAAIATAAIAAAAPGGRASRRFFHSRGRGGDANSSSCHRRAVAAETSAQMARADRRGGRRSPRGKGGSTGRLRNARGHRGRRMPRHRV